MKSTPLGYAFAIIAFTIFSVQAAVSKHLGMNYPPVLLAMFFALVSNPIIRLLQRIRLRQPDNK